MTLSRIASLLAACLALASLTPAAAQQQAPARPQVVAQFDDTMITYLLQDIQATWQIETNSDGSSLYRAGAAGGLNFTLVPRGCNAQGQCAGLMMLAVFTGLEGADARRLEALLNEINDRSPTAKVFRSDGVVILQSYINASFGISYRNAQAQMLVFGEDIVLVSRALAQLEQGG